jgi:hypothetical protein
MVNMNHLIQVERQTPAVQKLQSVDADDDLLFNADEIRARVLSAATPPEAPRPMPEQRIRYWSLGMITRTCADLLVRPFRRP